MTNEEQMRENAEEGYGKGVRRDLVKTMAEKFEQDDATIYQRMFDRMSKSQNEVRYFVYASFRGNHKTTLEFRKKMEDRGIVPPRVMQLAQKYELGFILTFDGYCYDLKTAEKLYCDKLAEEGYTDTTVLKIINFNKL